MLMKLGTVAVILSSLLLGLNSIASDSRSIATTLRTLVDGRIQAEPIQGVVVTADGRDISLTGRVSDEAARIRAEDLAQSIFGVRTVSNRLEFAGGPVSRDGAGGSAGPVAPVNVAAVQTELQEILANNKIEFQLSRSTFLDSSMPALGQLASLMEREPGIAIDVQGFTDNSGSDSQNRVISQQRAEAVVAWLAERGIESARMQANGFGPDRPIATNDTAEGRAQNRRVEIVASLVGE